MELPTPPSPLAHLKKKMGYPSSSSYSQPCAPLLPVIRNHETSLHSSAEVWMGPTGLWGSTSVVSLGNAARAAQQPRGHRQVSGLTDLSTPCLSLPPGLNLPMWWLVATMADVTKHRKVWL